MTKKGLFWKSRSQKCTLFPKNGHFWPFLAIFKMTKTYEIWSKMAIFRKKCALLRPTFSKKAFFCHTTPHLTEVPRLIPCVHEKHEINKISKYSREISKKKKNRVAFRVFPSQYVGYPDIWIQITPLIPRFLITNPSSNYQFIFKWYLVWLRNYIIYSDCYILNSYQ